MKTKRLLAIIFAFAIALTMTFNAVPASAVTFGDGDFGYNLDSRTNTAVLVKYVGSASEVNIPSQVYGYKVVAIKDGVFLGKSAVQKVVIPSTVTSIGDYAFCSSGLQEISFSRELDNIGSYAFAYCSSLSKAVIPKTVTCIDEYAFEGDDNINIYCYKDSCAHRLASSKGLGYTKIDELYKIGDANFDGNVDIKDATKIQKYIAGSGIADELFLNFADANRDDTLNIFDVTLIQKSLVGLAEL